MALQAVCERAARQGAAYVPALLSSAIVYAMTSHTCISPTSCCTCPCSADGFAAHQRANANGVDLNRNFPDAHILCRPDEEHCDVSVLLKTNGVQPEVAAVMRWIEGANAKSQNDVVHFTASANLHEGSIVANYPYDAYSRTSQAKIAALAAQAASTRQRPDVGNGTAVVTSPSQLGASARVPSVSPDDATFKFMAHTYANAHRTMHDSTEFPGMPLPGVQRMHAQSQCHLYANVFTCTNLWRRAVLQPADTLHMPCICHTSRLRICALNHVSHTGLLHWGPASF